MIKGVLATDLPMFGICLGHQMLALALGAQTIKMNHGHHGACGLRVADRPVFSVQYHPEASPGPQDSYYLFERFAEAMAARAA